MWRADKWNRRTRHTEWVAEDSITSTPTSPVQGLTLHWEASKLGISWSRAQPPPPTPCTSSSSPPPLLVCARRAAIWDHHMLRFVQTTHQVSLFHRWEKGDKNKRILCLSLSKSDEITKSDQIPRPSDSWPCPRSQICVVTEPGQESR